MAVYTTIDNPELYFQAKTYAGNGTAIGSGGQAVTLDGDEDMQPDFVWIKDRSDSDRPRLFDSVRGTTKSLDASDNSAEDTNTEYLTAFGSNGFTVGNHEGVNSSGDNFVAWCWKGGTTSGLSGGDITPSPYSYNATSGFGIYKYTGNGSTDQEIPHGLGKKPQMIFFKRLDSSTNWVAQSNLLGNRVQLALNDTTDENTDSRLGASDDWSSTIFNVGTYGDMNSSGDPHVAYAFCNIQGYSKIGTYTGNGNADGTFVYTGFRPAYILQKIYNGADSNWLIFDNKRTSFNEVDKYHIADTSDSESSETVMDFLSNGFKFRAQSTSFNNSGYKYIYMAFAEAPFVNSNGVPCNAR